jgi:deoxyribonuclease-4
MGRPGRSDRPGYPPSMRIGAHVRDDDPVAAATERGAEVVQFFLADPQGWQAPEPHPRAEALLAADLTIVIHSPYVLNVASTNNRIRIPSRKGVLQHAAGAAALGALGLVVHGGHLTKGEDAAVGLANWRKLFERQAQDGGFPVPILIENTAGGDNAMARGWDMLARLWDEVGEFGAGFCLDTCHAFAAGEDLADIVDRTRAITGRIDLVHLNNSRDEFGSTRDRHANLAEGTIDAELLADVVRAADAPVVVETPADGQADDIAYLRAALRR